MAPIAALFVGYGGTAAFAPTAGLFGAGGSFTAAGVGTALSAAGAVSSGMSAHAEGKATSKLSEYNAILDEREAKAIEQKTKYDQVKQAERAQRILSSLKTKLAVSGARMDVGAPLMLIGEQAAELELENLMIGYEGQTMAQKMRSQGAIDITKAGIYKRKGKAAAGAYYTQAGETLLKGFSTSRG